MLNGQWYQLGMAKAASLLLILEVLTRSFCAVGALALLGAMVLHNAQRGYAFSDAEIAAVCTFGGLALSAGKPLKQSVKASLKMLAKLESRLKR